MLRHFGTAARAFATTSLLTFAFVAAGPRPAHASADYNVWYFDNNFNTFQPGDISDGWTKLVPPAWACGLVFDDPSYYRWVDQYGGTISSHNFNKDVRVWIPKPGCSEPLTIEYADGSQTFNHVSGASYMEISTNNGAHWINEDGSYPFCGNCVGPDEISYFPQQVDWAGMSVSAFKAISTLLFDARLRSGVGSALNRLGTQVRNLYPGLKAEIDSRRQAHLLGDREASVRVLEDAALKSLSDSSRLLDACTALAQQGRVLEAFSLCTLGGNSMDAAGSLIQSAQDTFRNPSH